MSVETASSGCVIIQHLLTNPNPNPNQLFRILHLLILHTSGRQECENTFYLFTLPLPQLRLVCHRQRHIKRDTRVSGLVDSGSVRSRDYARTDTGLAYIYYEAKEPTKES